MRHTGAKWLRKPSCCAFFWCYSSPVRNKFLGTGEPGYHPLRKVKVALAGLRFAVVSDFSVAYKVALSAGALVVTFAARAWMDFIVILVATALMLVAEVFNTAIEALCDFVEPNRNERIRAIKDVAAGATGIAIAVWAIVLAYESWRAWNAFQASP
jgi:diacylglycerol kinase